MTRSISRLVAVGVCSLALFGALPVHAQSFTIISSSRWLQVGADAFDDVSDQDFDQQQSMLEGPFNYSLTAAATVATAQGTAMSQQNSDIGAAGLQASAALDVSAMQTGGSATASALNELDVLFAVNGVGNIPYSMSGTFFATDSVTANLYLRDEGAGITLHSFTAPSGTTHFDLSGELIPGRTYRLRGYLSGFAAADPLTQSSSSHSSQYLVNLVLTAPTGVREGVEPVSRLQVWPNPFRASSTISLSPGALDKELLVHDVQGRVVRKFPVEAEDRELTWDGRDHHGNRLPGGVYFLRLTGARRSASERVTLLR